MTALELFTACLWSFGATACCACYMNAKFREILVCGGLGAISWGVYKFVFFKTGNAAAAYLAGAIAASALSELCAVFLHNPATVFLIPSLLPLVPGGGFFVLMRSALQKELSLALSTAYDTFTAAMAIALGVAISSSASKIIHSFFRKSWRHSR